MKKNIVFLFVVFGYGHSFSQTSMPKYYDALKKFFTTYEDEDNYENYTSFAKKKKGWYIQKINRVEKDKLLKEYLFWDISTKEYQNISDYFDTTSNTIDWEKKAEPYLNYDWYGYDRVRYFGYNRWALDMINDFAEVTNLNDTMYEGLSRAYNNKAYNYLWYQQGGSSDNTDTLQIQLKRLQNPSEERIKKVEENILQSIVYVKKVKAFNKNYETIIGNADLKVFNQQMNGYNQMYMVGDYERANNFINDITLDERYILQAKNYLNSCAKNGILFTYGDNDTYQLWYIQKKLNYRLDVSVINTSLLGIPSYINQLRVRNEVKIAAPNSFLENRGSDVTYYQEDIKTIKSKPLFLNKFLENIYLRKSAFTNTLIADPDSKISSFSAKEVLLQNPSNPKNSLSIKLKNYLFLNDLIMLDIIQSNIYKRPIYFTTDNDIYFDTHLTQTGITYNIHFKKNTEAKIKEIHSLESFIQKKYVPIISNYDSASNFILVDGDKAFVLLYTKIIDYYLAKKDNPNIKKWLNEFNSKASTFSINQIPSLRLAEETLIKAKSKTIAFKIIEMDATYLHSAYTNPSYLKTFYSKAKYKASLTRLSDLLDSAGLKSKLVTDLLNIL